MHRMPIWILHLGSRYLQEKTACERRIVRFFPSLSVLISAPHAIHIRDSQKRYLHLVTAGFVIIKFHFPCQSISLGHYTHIFPLPMTYHNWGHASHYLTHVCTLHQSPWTPDATVYITFSLPYPLTLHFFLIVPQGGLQKIPRLYPRHSNVLPQPSFLSPSRPPFFLSRRLSPRLCTPDLSCNSLR
ncbi:hypothetical protein M378DRAFT_214037 [Amanita muscaria Koide BX008]|uniref:Uncharacterized protein n=1 Tax=Amanita muscaria (strain Koide BX008) TaxID=946122 RepID=A0A0C2TVI7_AMAMK|nr:hypothetical protein M378DRAFT_214037 [Amanita muscaria Koide BX008]